MVKKIKRISKICRKIEIVYGFLYLGQIKEQEIKRPMKPEYNAFGWINKVFNTKFPVFLKKKTFD